jgi:hypothetical protein
MGEAQAQYQQTGHAARLFKEFVYQTRKSWSRARRVRQFHGLEKPRVDIRNEHMAGGADSLAQPSGYGSDSFAQFPRSSFSRC